MSGDERPIEKLTVNELKAELKARNLPVNGLKTELIARLQEAKAKEEASAAGQDADHAGMEDLIPDEQAEEPENNTVEQDVDIEAAGDGGDAQAGGAPEGEEAADAAHEQQDQQEEEHAEHELGPPEWEQMEIPKAWLPAPIVRVSNLPMDSSCDDLKALLEEGGLSVSSVVLEAGSKGGRQAALVRFQPLPLPWCLTEEELATPVFSEGTPATAVKAVAAAGKDTDHPMAEQVKADAADANGAAAPAEAEAEAAVSQKTANGHDTTPAKDGHAKVAAVPAKKTIEDDGRRHGDALKMSRYLASKLKQRKLKLGMRLLDFDATPPAVTLFVGNLGTEDDQRFRDDMAQYGSMDRCFIMRSADGSSKGYGFVEFCLPASAAAAMQKLDERYKREFKAAQARQAARAKAKQAAAEAAAKEAAAEEEVGAEDEKEEKEEAREAAAEEEAEAAEAAAKEEASEAPVKEAAGEEAAEAKAESQESEEAAEQQEKEKVEEVKEEAAEQMDAESAPAAEAVEEGTSKDAATARLTQPERSEDVEEVGPADRVQRAEWFHPRTVASLFSKSLYVANLPQGKISEEDLKALFEEYGPLKSFHIWRDLKGGSKGFAFVEYERSDVALAALRGIDCQVHPEFGKVLVSFQNPAKVIGPVIDTEAHGGRGTSQARIASGRGRGGRMPMVMGHGMMGYGGRMANFMSPQFSGRGGAFGMGGRGGAFGMGMAGPGFGFGGGRGAAFGMAGRMAGFGPGRGVAAGMAGRGFGGGGFGYGPMPGQQMAFGMAGRGGRGAGAFSGFATQQRRGFGGHLGMAGAARGGFGAGMQQQAGSGAGMQQQAGFGAGMQQQAGFGASPQGPGAQGAFGPQSGFGMQGMQGQQGLGGQGSPAFAGQQQQRPGFGAQMQARAPVISALKAQVQATGYGAQQPQRGFAGQAQGQAQPGLRAGSQPGFIAQGQTGFGAQSQAGFGAQGQAGYGAQMPSGYGAQEQTGYGAQVPSGLGVQGQRAQAPSGFGGQGQTGYGAQMQSDYGPQAQTGYGMASGMVPGSGMGFGATGYGTQKRPAEQGFGGGGLQGQMYKRGRF